MPSQSRKHKVGDLRPSQLVFTFGVGSLMDLPNLSTIIMGLDDWDSAQCERVNEERLLSAVKKVLGKQVHQLCLPPVSKEEMIPGVPEGDLRGVPVVPFPRWGRCSRCNLLARLDDGVFELQAHDYRPDKTRYYHTNCTGSRSGYKPTVLPVRFLVACRNGHLDDFPWVEYVHRGPTSCSPSILRMRERGPSGEARDILIVCDTCGATRTMAEAFGADALLGMKQCSGSHPHLRRIGQGGCEEEIKTVTLSASNNWFPLMLSTLSIPRTTDDLSQKIDEYWGTVQFASTLDIVRAFRATGQLAAFAAYSDSEILDAIQRKQAQESGEPDDLGDDLKLPEWIAFTNADPALNSPHFKLQEVKAPFGYEHLITKVVLAKRLRQVCALLGFTRVESPGDFQEQAEIEENRRAPLSRRPPTWIPATEVRGEGVFIQFNEDAVQAWCHDSTTMERGRKFLEAHKLWRSKRKLQPPDAGYPGMRFVLIHSFAHALMRQFSLECGYTAASIRERIYSREPDQDGGPMAGLLIYTGAPDSEGTLGGLVRMGKPEILGHHIDQALEQLRFCSSDPFCAEQELVRDGMTIHGAACHACLFAPETSCERGNKYLDRNSLIKAFGSLWAAYFEKDT